MTWGGRLGKFSAIRGDWQNIFSVNIPVLKIEVKYPKIPSIKETSNSTKIFCKWVTIFSKHFCKIFSFLHCSNILEILASNFFVVL